MSDVLIVKNVSREGPGLLEAILERAQLSYDLVDLDKAEAFPNPTGYKAVIVLGGPDSANDSTQKITDELVQIQVALANNTPYLGICLGLQLLVKAAGGRVVPATEKEIGFVDSAAAPYKVELTAAGQADPLLAGLPPVLPVFQLHGETVELTDDMDLLATGVACPNQIVRVGAQAYGIQSHFEVTPEMLRTWAEQDPDLQPIGAATLQTQLAAIQSSYTETGEALFTNFLRIAKLV